MAAQIESRPDEKLKPEITVFMLVKTTTEWLGFTVDQRFKHMTATVQPILQKYKGKVRLRFYDTEFYSSRVTDMWVWEASSHAGYQLLVEELRETPFWDRFFEIVEILPGVENAYAQNYGRQALAS